MYEEVFNIFLGLSLGIIIANIISEKIKYHGPNSKYVKSNIFKYKNKCYIFIPKIEECSFFSSHD